MKPAPSDYEILVYHKPDGWRRVALLPYTLGWALVSMIAEDCQLAWIAPIRVVRGSECIVELGKPLKAA